MFILFNGCVSNIVPLGLVVSTMRVWGLFIKTSIIIAKEQALENGIHKQAIEESCMRGII